MNSKPHQNRIRTDSNNSATTMGSCSSTSTSLYLSSATLTKTSDILIGGIPSNEHSIANMAIGRDYSPSASSSRPLNAMQWMQNDCPKDVVPLILAFAGPQKIATIGKTNPFWRELIEQESTWRRLCEMLYKWKEGDDIPKSWKKYYQFNPCVPVDYSSIHTAIRKTTVNAKKDSSRPKAFRVLLRPGRYDLRKAISIYDGNDRNSNRSLSLTIETMAYSPGNLGYHGIEPRLSSDRSKRKLRASIRSIFKCRTVDVESEEEEDFDYHDSLSEDLYDSLSSDEEEIEHSTSGDKESNRATLVLSTRRQDEPLVRVTKGSFTMRNINLRHGSSGNDIWNGNAAIQIQPAEESVSESFQVQTPTPTVTLDCVDVTSWSGRGIVNVDGGHLKIKNSYVHDCAATGIYVGGTGSSATIERSDIIGNGKGNKKSRRGISAGHSGLYLEQGDASIIDCNISRNTLTGVSAISPDNAILNLQESELISNGTFQLEMPAFGSAAHRNSVTTNNTMESSGIGRSRSMLMLE
eukprot:CAMPEP_0197277028 /NCGR_PEP_ID=MMETSP1432-20130617/16398_1 /TAXON_ID=44447 /ORGANISM="Pseudo-nitzschia delicatissima, Strain UNC1205" /LENGTH=521 /DNA_ID=CAMNT_0042743173 /DNA_START=235 /DNA_END=1800 /DNA_ORIENTATION=+